MKVLSVIIPVFNEEKTLRIILEKIKAVPLEKEIIIVDDFSTDNTRKILAEIEKEGDSQLKILYHEKNHGKGRAIRTGIELVTGDAVIIQDADLEYEPMDYLKLIPPIFSGEYQVLYGSRFLNKQNTHSYKTFLWGGRLVSFITNILYFQNLSDEPTCYKAFDTKLLKSINLKCERFEFCPEVTAKVARKGFKIKEIPINYYPRSIEEGKKIKWYDGVEAIWTLVKYRFVR